MTLMPTSRPLPTMLSRMGRPALLASTMALALAHVALVVLGLALAPGRFHSTRSVKNSNTISGNSPKVFFFLIVFFPNNANVFLKVRWLQVPPSRRFPTQLDPDNGSLAGQRRLLRPRGGGGTGGQSEGAHKQLQVPERGPGEEVGAWLGELALRDLFQK